MQFKSPTGSRIVGTLEKLSGVANVSGFNDDGSPIYAGGTDIDWNSQQSIKRGDSLVYVDEDGEEWARRELTAVLDLEDNKDSQ